MFQRKFHFDHQTLRYVRVKRTLKTRLIIILLFISLSVSGAILVYKLSVRLGINPKVSQLELENTELIMNYKLLNERMNDYDRMLGEYQVIDDSIYRCILEKEPLPSYIRQPGLGGSDPYSYLEGYNSSDLMVNTSQRLDYLVLRTDIQYQSFVELAGDAYKKSDLLNRKPSIQPVFPGDPYWISSVFGVRIDPVTKVYTRHFGLDFAARIGTNVYATGDGIVDYMKISNNGYGKEVVIDHGYGYSSRYAHMNKILVHKGQKIRRGQIVGTIGNSGKSTGPHLHYEVRFQRKPLNPYYFFSDDLTPEEYEKVVSLSDKVDN